MNLKELAREAVNPTAWYIMAGVAIVGLAVVLALAGPLSKL